MRTTFPTITNDNALHQMNRVYRLISKIVLKTTEQLLHFLVFDQRFLTQTLCSFECIRPQFGTVRSGKVLVRWMVTPGPMQWLVKKCVLQGGTCSIVPPPLHNAGFASPSKHRAARFRASMLPAPLLTKSDKCSYKTLSNVYCCFQEPPCLSIKGCLKVPWHAILWML